MAGLLLLLTTLGGAPAHAQTGICGRTAAVQTEILGKIGVSDCANVTNTHLVGITDTLDLNYLSITTLAAGDFDGLTALTQLWLAHNALTTLPAGVFDDLTSLTTLTLNDNSLATLPAGVFQPLTSLTTLALHSNTRSFLPIADALPDDGTVSDGGGTVTLNGSGSDGGPWGTNVTYSWALTSIIPGLMVTFDDNTSAMPMVTISALTAGTRLTFTLTVTGRGATIGATDTAQVAAMVPNDPPVFSADTADRSVAENTAAGQDVGDVLTATDDDGDTLTYTPEGADAASFDIVTTSGSAQIRTKAGITYNFEDKSSYSVTIKADDGKGGTDTIAVTIAVTDVDEPPGVPAPPSVSATRGSGTSLNVTWTAPANTGPDIASYDLQYREGTSGDFTDGPQNVTGKSGAIGSLAPNTSYEVQVRATNAEGDGDWSESGTGRTAAVPGAPTGFRAEAGDGRVRLAWGPPMNPGGSSLIRYEYRYAGGASVPETTAWTSMRLLVYRTVLLEKLRNGAAHAFEVRAVSGEGAGVAATVSATPTAAVCSAPDLGNRRKVWAGTLTVGLRFPGSGSQGNTVGGYLAANTIGSFPEGTGADAPYTVSTLATSLGDSGTRMPVSLGFADGNVPDAVRAALRFHWCSESSEIVLASGGQGYETRTMGVDFSLYPTREVALSLSPNNDATGTPTISGIKRAGETLTAVQGTIADPDGVPSTFTYEWIRIDGANEEPITGETSSTYTLTGDDIGKQIKVAVSFTDLLGEEERRESETTAQVGSSDTIAPTVTSIVRQTPAASPTNADSLTWRVTFSEAVANVDAADFTVSGTTATPTAVSEVTASTVYDVTASGGDLASLDATVTLTFANNQNIADLADNDLTNTTPTGTNDNTFAVDNTAPTVAITGVPATSTAAFTATLTFSEGVEGFAVGDIAVGNGAASAFTGTDGATVYTAQIAPTADGTVTVDVAAGAARDAAGNDNTAAERASSTYTAPGICRRTEAVRNAILTEISSVSDCALVTPAHLAAITGNLFLANRSVTALAPGDFTGLTSLTELYLFGNDLTMLPAGVFDGLTSLTTLHLGNNDLTTLPAGMFDGLTALTTLSLGSNALTTLPDGVFDGLTSLTLLALHRNALTTLPAGVFDELTSLTSLDLSTNQLTTLPAGVFDGLTSLTLLTLPVNQLTTLPAGVFDGLTSLTSLSLQMNALTTLPAGVFDGLTSLTTLNLGESRLTTLPAGVFDELTSLTTLHLYGNALTTLPAGVFDELTSLTSLSLTTNQLTTLPAGVFDELTSLTSLNLSTNQLTTLPAGVFDELTSLTLLRLAGNPGAPFAPAAVALPDDGTVSSAGGTVTLDGSGSGGPWGANVTYSWALTAPSSGVTVTFDDDASATPVVTIPALAAGTELTFTLTVTGRFGSDGVAPGTDTARVTVKPPDTVAPTVTSIERQAPSSSPTNADVLTWRVTFSEAVANVDAADFTVSGTTATPTAAAVQGSSTQYDVTATGGDLDSLNATMTLTFANNQNIADLADNALTNITPTGTNDNTFAVDNTAPTVAITGVPATSTAAFTATLTFSEGVTGFAVGDIAVGNGAASAFTGTDGATVYTAQIAPTADGTVTVDVAAGAARDAAGNNNTAAERASSTYTAPDICGRTEVVRNAILALISGVNDCALVTDEHLAAITVHLNLISSSISAVAAGDFAGLTSLAQLSLGGNALTTLPAGVFADLTSLTFLGLDGNDLTTLPAGVFAGLTSLPKLELSNQSLAALPAGVFDGLTSLTHLLLINNDLTTLPAGVFDGLTSLTELELRGNDLTTLPAGVFDGLTSLPELNLSYQSLTTLPARVFAGLTSLTRLKLNDNALTTLPAGVFAGLTSLTELLLFENALTTLPAGVFDGLTSLPELDLSDHSLTRLPAGVFAGLTSLTDLFLYNNSLTTLPAEVFDGLTSLTTLGLGENALTRLPAGVFAGLTSLTDLFLYNNSLTTLPAGVFDGLISLEEIWLNHNMLTTLPDDVFEPLTSLTTLLLSDNTGARFAPAAVALPDNGTVPVAGGTVTLDGSGSGGAWGANVTYSWALTAPTSGVTVTFDDAMSATPTVTIPALTAGAELTFTLTVTGRGGTSGIAPGTDTARVTVPDNTAPTVTSIARQTPASSPTNADALTWRVTFSEAVANVDAADFAVTGTTATVTAVTAVSSVTGGWDVTASGGDLADLDATVTLAFANNQNIADLADNALTNITPTETNDNTFAVDNTAPTVTITGVPDMSSAAFTATITFTEPVTGFVLADITLTNATASNFTGADGETAFTALITPSANGAVTVDVAVDVAMDAAGNGNTAAARASSTYDPNASICGRTEAMQTAILAKISGVSACANVTSSHLAGITGTLSLDRMSITALAAGDFAGLTALTDLRLDNNDLSSLPAGVFAELTALTDLRLDDNDLSSLPSGVFDEMTSLTDLRLDNNDLSSLPSGVFDEMTSLTDLRLDNNDLSSLPAGVFDPLTSLLSLGLGGNDLSSLPSGVFDALTSLRSLSLAGNDLSTLPAGVFDEMTALTLLELSYNDLSTLPAGVFDALTSLTELFLAGNDLATLRAGVFDGLTSLRWLDLENNELATLRAGVFADLTSLGRLELSGNPGAPFSPTAVALPDDGTVSNDGGTVDLDGSGSDGEPWGANVTYSWALTNPSSGVTVTFDNSRLDSPAVTVPPLAAGTELTFTLTVTGRGSTNADSSGVALATDTARVTATATDTIAPTVTSILRQTPASSPTNADVLTWRVTFSEDVANVDGADFEVSGTSATLAAAAVPGSSAQYDVTASGGDLGSLNATVTLAFDADQDIADAAGNALANTTPTGANEASYVVDNTAPGVASILRQSPPSSPTHADILSWRVTFSEGVANVDTADFEVSGTSATLAAAAVSGSSRAYAVTASGGDLGSLDATVTLAFANNQNIADLAGNALATTTPAGANENAFVVDNTAPGVEISGVPETSTAAFTATITFSEGVNGFAVEDIAVGNGTASAFTGSDGDTEFTALITPAADGAVTVDVAADAAADAAGNGNTAAARASSTYDPNAGICGRTEAVRNAILAKISEVSDCVLVTDEHLAAITEMNVTVTALAAGDFAGLTALSSLDLDNNQMTTLPAGVFDGLTALRTLDLHGNALATLPAGVFDGLTALTDLFLFGNMLTTLPAGVFDALTALETLNLSGNNALATLPAGVFVRLTALETLYLHNNNLATLPAGVFDGLTSLMRLRLAGNSGAPFAPAAVALPDDGTVPVAGGTVTLDGSGSDGGPWGANVTYSWALTDPSSGVTVMFDNAASATPAVTIPALAAGTGLTFTLTVTGRGSTHAISTGVATATDTARVTATDTVAPTVTSILRQTPASSPTNADALTWRVTFSEDVANVDAADFTVSNTSATLTAAAVQGSSLAYDVTAAGGNLGSLDATVTLAFANNQNIADLADNALTNTAPTGANENAFVVDNTAPTVTITGVPDMSSAAFTATITFTEPVTGFVLADITLTNATASNFTGADGETAFTALITPSANGAVTVDVAVDVAMDAAGNGNTAAARASSTYDNTAPTVASIARQAPTASPANADSLTWRVTFSEAVENVDTTDFTVTGTTATLTVAPVALVTGAYDVTAAGGNLAGLDATTVTLAFAANQNIADAANNALANTMPSGANDNTFVLDNTAPTVTITGVPDMSSAAFTATITFTEPVTGFVLADITLTNATASNFTGADGDTAFTALITPSANGAVTVDVAVDVAMDAAGNGNTAAVRASSTYDNTAPTVASIARQAPTASPANADSLTWRVTFSEAVENVDTTDFTVTGTTATLTVAPVALVTGAYDVTAAGGNLGSLDATVTLAFDANQNIADAANNALANTMPSGANDNTFVLDNTAPTVTITGVPDMSSAAFTATITFTEPVTGFVLTDIALTNATASNFTGADGETVFTALITPSANGAVTVDVAVDVAADAAGNGNTAAVQASSTYDPNAGICGRTEAVQTAILGKISGVTACADVTSSHLAAITGTLSLGRMSITALAAGDFDGLTSLTTLFLHINSLATLPAGVFDALSALTTLFLNTNSLATLPSGVFDGLTSLTDLDLGGNDLSSLPAGVFDELTSLTDLELDRNDLSSLPAGVFDGLTSLTDLNLGGNDLSSLPAGVFDELTALTGLNLNNNDLSTLPAGVFDELTSLTLLNLGGNDLSSLPAGVFDELTSLRWLDLENNELATLRAGVFADLTALGRLELSGNPGAPFSPTAVALPDDGTVSNDGGTVDLDGSGSDGGPWGANVTYSWALTNPSSGVTVTFDNSRLDSPAVTVPPLAGGTELTFTLTVTGRGSTHADSSGAALATDTARVTATDTIAPTVTSILRQTPASSPTNADALTWRVTFSEDVANVDAADFTVSNTSATLTAAAVQGSSLAYDVTAAGGNLGSLDATVTLAFANNQNIADLADNALTNTAPTGANENAFVVDNTAPTVTITGVPGMSSAAFTATITFTEPVTGFVLADITLANATASNFTGADGETAFTALITPSANGAVTVDVAVDVAMDAAGNGNTAAVQASSLYDPNAGICGRTEAVQTAILAEISGVSACANVTSSHLAAITGRLSLRDRSISALAAGDFAGLTSLTTLFLNNNSLATLPAGVFDELTALTDLRLDNNDLSSLPAGVFDEMTALTGLFLNNNDLSSLPAGVFDELTALTQLWLYVNDLDTLRAGVFDELTALTGLELDRNDLSSLPAGVFDELTALTLLNLDGNDLSSLPAGVFDELTALTGLNLNNNDLSSLPAGVFDELTALTELFLAGNDLATLRAGVFDGLTSLRWLDLENNELATLRAGVFADLTALGRLELSGNPGAPFSPTAVALPDDGTVSNDGGTVDLDGSGSDGGPWGANVTYSWALTNPSSGVTVTFDNSRLDSPAVTVPPLAGGTELTFTLTVTGRSSTHADSSGAVLATDTARVTAGNEQFCARTAAVQTAILAKISGVSACANVTSSHLAAITGDLSLDRMSITALAAGDFAGLTALTDLRLNNNDLSSLPAGVFDALTSLTDLDLNSNGLATLPAGVFDALTSLTGLDLTGNTLATLPASVFARLTSLTAVTLGFNDLTALPAGVFDALTSLTFLGLENNDLATLPAGVFDVLTSLTWLRLPNNNLATLPAGVFDGMTSLLRLELSGNPGAPFAPTAVAVPDDGTVPVAGGTVTLDGSGSDGGPWGANVTYSWALTDPSSGVTVTFDDAASATPAVTIPALTAGTGLTFTLTVTGRGSTHADSTSVDPATDTARVTATATDTIAPTVTSILRQTPASSPTNADVLTWRVTFSEDVANVEGADFEVSGTSATLAAAAVSGSSAQYDVTASGGDLGSLNATVTLAFDADQDIADAAGNALANTTPTGANEASYVVDNTAPGVASILRQSPPSSPTHADILSWRVTFSEGVANVDTADFEVSGTSATLAAAAVSGSSRAYAVTASGGDLGSLDATVTLAFANNQNIADLADNALATTTPAGANENAFVVDNTAPGVEISGVPETSTAAFTATITFSEGVNGFAVEDIAVGNGTASAFTGSDGDTEFTALITPAADGAVTVDVAADAAADAAGNGNTAAARASSTYDPNAGICGRTEAVRNAILAKISEVSDCVLVTDEHLAAITEMNVTVTALAAGDFAGLTALSSLDLDNNQMTTLPAGVFDGLTALRTLDLHGNALATLPAGVFDGLTALTDLFLFGNMLTTLPAGVFDALTALRTLNLSGNNALATLPAGVFVRLTALETLYLHNNNLATLPAGVFDGLTSLMRLRLAGNSGAPFAPAAVALPDDGTVPVAGGTVTLDGSGSDGGPWGANVTYSWALTDPSSGVTVMFDNAASATPAVTIPALAAGTGLTFTLTVTGRGSTHANSTGVALATDTARVTATDTIAPTVTSILRQTPASSPTNADALTWRVTFSEDVANVDAADFTVSNTSATLTAAAVSGSSAQYDVTASGGDLGSLDATVTLAFANNQNIADLADNALTNTAPTGANENAFVVDNTAPTVTITGVPDMSSAAFTATITFTEPVTGFVLTDITLTNATASNFTGADGETAFTALITPSANGAVTVDVAVDVAMDAAGNGNTAAARASSTYDNTAPTVASIARQAPTASPANADSLTWRVTFSEAVENVDTTDFTVTGTTATLTVAPVALVTGAYDVTAAGGNLGSLDATVTLAFDANQNIADAANNALANTMPSGANDNTFELDNTAPNRAPGTASPTNADSLTWRVTFSEAVENVDTTDFTVTGTTATLTVAPVTLVTGAYDVTAAGGNLGSLDATVTLAFAANQNIADAANNALANTMPSGANDNTFELDNTAPTVASIARQAPTASPANADSLTWRVTFSEAVANVDAPDFTITGTTATLTVTPVTNETGAYDVTATAGDLAGLDATVTLAFAQAQDIADPANNALTNTMPTGTNEASYVVDNTAPGVAISGVPDASTAPFTATITFTEGVAGFAVGDITVGNGTASAFTGADGDTEFTALITPTADGAVTVDVAADVAMDAAGNGNTAATRVSSTYTAPTTDTVAPTVSSVMRQSPTSSPTNADVLTWRVTFSEAVANVDAADFTVAGTTATLTATAVSGSSAQYDVTVSGGNLAGLDATVTLAFVAGQNIQDAAGNALANTTPTGANEASYVVDNIAPTVTISGVSPTSTAAFTVTITFSEGVNGFAVGDITVGNGTASAFTGSGGDTEFTALITPTADGAVTVDVAADVAMDAAGNGNTAAAQASSIYDNTAPTVASIMRQTPTSSPTNADVLTWRVTFSEAVANVDAADFAVSNTTATLTATAVSGLVPGL